VGCAYRALLIEAQEQINQTIPLTSFGSFVVKIGCSGMDLTVLSNVIKVACAAGYRPASGTCVLISEAINCGPDSVAIGTLCKQRPILRPLSDALALFAVVPKTPDRSRVEQLPITIVLHGGFDVQWKADASFAHWLTSRPSQGNISALSGYQQGTISSGLTELQLAAEGNTAGLVLCVNASDLRDWSIDGDYHGNVRIASLVISNVHMPFEGKRIEVPLRLRVEAKVFVTLQDIAISTEDGAPRGIGSEARVEGVEVLSRVRNHYATVVGFHKSPAVVTTASACHRCQCSCMRTTTMGFLSTDSSSTSRCKCVEP
jgi:hypothetical protein